MLVQRGRPLQRDIVYDFQTIDNETVSNIEEVLYSWQKNKSDADDKYLLKRYSLSEITLDESTKTFTVTVLNTDFDNVIDGEAYNEIFSIKYQGDTIFRDYVLMNSKGTEESLIEIEGNWTQINT